jgi:hypothetical protein
MEIRSDAKRLSNVQMLPLRPSSEVSKNNAEALRQVLEEYIDLVKHIKTSVVFFLDNISTKYNEALLVNQEELKLYENTLDLFTFNHFDMKQELKEFDKKEARLVSKADSFFGTGSRIRSESFIHKFGHGSNGKSKVDQNNEELQVKILKLNKKNKMLKKVIKDLRMKHQQALLNLEGIQVGGNSKQKAEATNKEKILDAHSQNFDVTSLEKPSSVNDLERRYSKNLLIMNKSFDSIPEENGPSAYAFNPNKDSRSRNFSLNPNGRRRPTFGDANMIFENMTDNASHKEDLGRQDDEIDLLNREVEILKREIREKNKEKALLIDKYEKSIRQEKESASKVIHNLRQNIKFKEEKESELASLNELTFMKYDPNRSVSKFDENRSQVSDLRNSVLQTQMDKKNKTLNMLKESLDAILKEKQALQQQVNGKARDITDLQNQISSLENTKKKAINDISELEMTNSQLTTKFLSAVERENDLLKMYNQMKVKLRAYEKYINSLGNKN